MGNTPPPGFRLRQASAFAKALADKLAGQVGVRKRRGGRKMDNYPLDLRPAKIRDAPSRWEVLPCGGFAGTYPLK
jgi:hypothetical protein